MNSRSELLERIVADVATNGIGDRSLRELALAVNSNHRMVIYHFGSRSGLVTAIVACVEESQRQLLRELATTTTDSATLILALWHRLSAPKMRPFVRLFFETVASSAHSADDSLTYAWLKDIGGLVPWLTTPDLVEIRLGIAVTRGLLIDVVASNNSGPATKSLKRFIAMWQSSSQS